MKEAGKMLCILLAMQVWHISCQGGNENVVSVPPVSPQTAIVNPGVSSQQVSTAKPTMGTKATMTPSKMANCEVKSMKTAVRFRNRKGEYYLKDKIEVMGCSGSCPSEFKIQVNLTHHRQNIQCCVPDETSMSWKTYKLEGGQCNANYSVPHFTKCKCMPLKDAHWSRYRPRVQYLGHRSTASTPGWPGWWRSRMCMGNKGYGWMPRRPRYGWKRMAYGRRRGMGWRGMRRWK